MYSRYVQFIAYWLGVNYTQLKVRTYEKNNRKKQGKVKYEASKEKPQ